MGVLLSSPLSQWTLLLASLPLVYFAHGMLLGDGGNLVLDSRQRSELLLTGAQAIFGVVALARLRLSWQVAVTLALIFLAQLTLGIANHEGSLWLNRDLFSLLYFALALGMLLGDRGRVPLLWHLITQGLGISKKGRSVAPGPLEADEGRSGQAGILSGSCPAATGARQAPGPCRRPRCHERQ